MFTQRTALSVVLHAAKQPPLEPETGGVSAVASAPAPALRLIQLKMLGYGMHFEYAKDPRIVTLAKEQGVEAAAQLLYELHPDLPARPA